jgi:glyoxylase-like metal-dependent hydrolase (beta-lactamase superfamily II)
MRLRRLAMTASLGATLLLAGSAAAQENPLKTQDLGNGIYVLFGPGGNIGASVGEDGVFLIDDKFDRLSDQIVAAVAEITDKPIRFLINTHWHGDHTGANRALSKIGSVIVAHDNVRARMSTEQVQEIFNRTVPAAPKEALPVITFDQQISFHLNGDEARVYHAPNAHTDGDSIIYFEQANVIHMGDLYFAAAYPFIDVDSGGGIAGLVAGLDLALSLINDETQVISGHGGVTTREEFQAYRDVAKAVYDKLQEMIATDKSLKEILAAKITSDFDEKWGNGYQGLNDPVSFVTLAYRSLTGKKE